MDAYAWPKFDGKRPGPAEKRRRKSAEDLKIVKRRPLVSDFGGASGSNDVVKSDSKPNVPRQQQSDNVRNIARKPVAFGQVVDPGLILSKTKDVIKTPVRPKPSGFRPMNPPAFVPPRPGPSNASTSSKASTLPRKTGPMKPLQPPFSVSKLLQTPMSNRTIRLDRIVPLNSASISSPARKIVPFNELPKPPQLNRQVVSMKSPKTELRTLSAPKFVTGSPSGLKSMSEINQPNAMDLDGTLWGNDPEDVFGGSENRELTRGLLVSPEKPGGKKNRFLKGGLAEMARTITNRSTTAHSLWQKDLEAQSHAISSSFSFSKYQRTLHPDLVLRVESVLLKSRVSGTSRGAGALRSVLTRCVLHQAVPSENGRNTLGLEDTAPAGDSLIVLFSFSDFQAGASMSSSETMFDMVEGTHLFVWKPYYEIMLSEASSEGGKALLCSRFLAIPQNT